MFRMRDSLAMLFFQVKSPSEARRLLMRPGPPPAAEVVSVRDALGRVTASEVRSPIDLPEFDRSVVDGFAVRAADTFGASPGLPALLRVTGEILMGQGTDLRLAAGEAARVPTGGMLPAGADAVVMVEHTDTVDAETIEASRPAAPGENVVRRGDDVAIGSILLPAGHRLRPPDLGALAGVGITELSVFRRPRVAILPTGDEIVAPEAVPGPGEVRDINSIALSAAVQEAGGEPLTYRIVRDEPEGLKEAVARALDEADLVLVAGGSSVGTRDWTLEVLLQFPGAELLLHGIAIRPGKPVIAVAIPKRRQPPDARRQLRRRLAVTRERIRPPLLAAGGWRLASGAASEAMLVVGLPGNPVSALVVFQQFVRPVIEGQAGRNPVAWRRGQVHAVMGSNYASDAGKEDYVRVRLRRDGEQIVAEPVLGKSALIMPLVQADGLVVIPEGVEGVEAGETVTVEVY
jgi:molybdopterin molybdotransferase